MSELGKFAGPLSAADIKELARRSEEAARKVREAVERLSAAMDRTTANLMAYQKELRRDDES
jgi:DNA-binding ferritin-like protein